ncbi:hypothetical protein AVEN_273202-1 [Araneus ventricosus]|uniref:Uncharacterized protein n=1 Tax=Araneus ventricosus TaxID=182803 RepID=A0A4Y2GSD7_ARAVE|nr:hypothetical protein AVEN_273202-1 [Araneus ventricosus]
MNAVSIPGSDELEVLSPSCIEIVQFVLSLATNPLATLINKCLGQLSLEDCETSTNWITLPNQNHLETLWREETHRDEVESAIHQPSTTPPPIFMDLTRDCSIIMSGATPPLVQLSLGYEWATLDTPIVIC